MGLCSSPGSLSQGLLARWGWGEGLAFGSLFSAFSGVTGHIHSSLEARMSVFPPTCSLRRGNEGREKLWASCFIMMASVISICDHQTQRDLNQCLSNFHVPVNHLEILRCRFRCTWPGMDPESLHFPSAPGGAMLLVPGPGLSRKGLKSPSLSQRRKPRPR